MVADYRLCREAVLIAEGVRLAPIRRAHVVALLELIASLRAANEERGEVIAALLEQRESPTVARPSY